MPRLPDFTTLRFAHPEFLWLLAVPGGLLVLWCLRIVRRRVEVHRCRGERLVPMREHYGFGGDLSFWLAVVVASGLSIVALAEPQERLSVQKTSGADIVLLQDGSASMYARDVQPDRWRRSIAFIHAFADTLSWKGDRVALALFAHLASPQVRLTSDPNALFFFIDHLGDVSPFRLEDDTTWDTNIEEGLYWGLKLIDKDQELNGQSGNAQAFVVISDGQAWSGVVAHAVETARRRAIPVYVVGVGTVTGAMIPQPAATPGVEPPPVVRTRLDRGSLRQIATAGGGQYFELGVEPDRNVAARIIADVKRRAHSESYSESYEELYWWFLLAAGVLICLGTLAIGSTTELLWQAGAAVAGGAVLAGALRLI